MAEGALVAEPLGARGLGAAERLALVRQCGDSAQAGAALQPGMSYVDVTVDGGTAFAACARALGRTIVLGEPIGDDRARLAAASAILKRDPGAIFFQVRPAFAAQLQAAHGLQVTPIGIEPTIALATWQLRGRRRQSIRTACHHADAEGIVVREATDGDDLAILTAPASSWEKTRRRRTLRFLVPPLGHRLAGLTRTFIAERDGSALGFVTFDAIVHGGVVVGYTPSVSRGSTRFRQGLWYVLMAHALEQFQREGIEHVNLGLVPLAREVLARPDAGLFGLLLRMLRVVGLPVYSFAGIEHAKSRFGGQPALSMMVHRGRVPVWGLLATLLLTFTGPGPVEVSVERG